MSKIKELFTYSTESDKNWSCILREQICRYTNKKCYKIRKSESNTAIGTCTVSYGKKQQEVMICPNRLLEHKQIFIDCLPLLKAHIPGNELHIVPEVYIPGGSVDYILVSTDSKQRVKDFVGIELQTLDTVGTVWPERQRLLKEWGYQIDEDISDKRYGINWKMTSKTILVQLLHKIDTFENVNKHYVLIIQDCLLDYMKKEFSFSHLSEVNLADSMHIHAYSLDKVQDRYKLNLKTRLSTDRNGVSQILGMQANANVDFEEIARMLQAKISDKTYFELDI